MQTHPALVQSLARALTESSFRALSVHWDMDGTLVDSEPLHIRKLIDGANRYGVTLTPEHFTTVQHFPVPDGQGGYRPASMVLHGAGDKNMYHWLVAQRPQLSQTLTQQVWLDELMAYYLANAAGLQAREEVSEVVQALHALGAQQAIVTSATTPQLNVCSNALRDIQPCVSHVLTADDVKRNKPEPDCYLASQSRAQAYWDARGVSADQVFHIAVEDSPTGVRAALAAKMPCVHYVLPGQAPFPAQPGQAFAAARHSSELLAAFTRLLDGEN